MQFKRALMAIIATVALATAALQAADVTGKWTAQVPGRDGQTREATFTFKVDGEKLTGTTTGRQGNEVELKDGLVKGDDISFNVVMTTQNGEIKMVYAGKVVGDELKLTRTVEGRDTKQEITAKRAKAAS